MLSYREYLKENATGLGYCFMCNKYGLLFQDGNIRFKANVCQKHARMKAKYANYKKDFEVQNKIQKALAKELKKNGRRKV